MTREKVIQVASGWSMLGRNVALMLGGTVLSILSLKAGRLILVNRRQTTGESRQWR